MTTNTNLILQRTTQPIAQYTEKEKNMLKAVTGKAMLEYEREQAKQVRRQVLPADRTYVRRQVDDAAIILLNEMRKAGPCTAKYLAEVMSISTHKSANLIKSLTVAGLAEKVCITRRSVVQEDNLSYRVGHRERNDCWVYKAWEQ